MKRTFTLYCLTTFIFAVFHLAPVFAQIEIDLTDNMDITSDVDFQFKPGDFNFTDTEKDGVIRIANQKNIILDGKDVNVSGMNFEGYFIRIQDSENITIKNFSSVSNFFYAVYIENATGISIHDCTFSENKKETEGWITISKDETGALGGGVFLNNCSDIDIHDNAMQYQNDGVAIYNSKKADIYNNLLSWNTAYGIRMYHADSCWIDNNDCAYTNRDTDPSDCAAILMYDSFDNIVTNNDFTYSGDGVFLNNYESDRLSNNFIAYNDCSYSPHNAIEATFSDGNIFRKNICNYSNYGLWLGYSYNCIVDSNEIHYNSGLDWDGGGAIAIDRGYGNVFKHNNITHNSHGVKLWEGNLISPYTNTSKDYLIEGNNFSANRHAIWAANTEELTIQENTFTNNWNDIQISGETSNSSINNNTFGNNAAYYIENLSPDDISAPDNTFPDNPELIACKIFDKDDNTASGAVNWLPYTTSENIETILNAPEDLAEPPAVWDAYYWVEDAAETTVTWDNVDKKTGETSLYVETKGGFNVELHYFPESGQLASWELIPTDSIHFWMKLKITDPNNFWGMQDAFVRIGNACGAYFQYTNDYFQNINPHILNEAIDQWHYFSIPLAGDSTWIRTQTGDIDFANISYVEFNVDVWEYGYQLWIDGINIPAKKIDTDIQPAVSNLSSNFFVYPNITTVNTNISLEVNNIARLKNVDISICDVLGRDVLRLENQVTEGNKQFINIPVHNFQKGLYFVKVLSQNQLLYVQKIIVN